ncbi:MAG: transposase [Alphaproteobacteria bacterium]|nr:transposase [Alphaproteobacteria bacterium]
MPRQARIVLPDVSHHVIQRGNRRQDVFFGEEDYKAYLSLLKEACEKARIRVQAYCLMTNHVHLVLVPSEESGLRPIGEAHRRYTRYMNMKKGWRGYLWQGRFGSYPMDEAYLYEAVRYVELNPVRAGLCQHPGDYRWSSARQRVGKITGDFKVAPSLPVDDWESYWQDGLLKYEVIKQFDDNELSFKPLGTLGTQ